MNTIETPQWYAIKTRQDFKAERILSTMCEEVFFPKETIVTPEHKRKLRPYIPRVLFLRTTADNILRLEQQSREHPELIPQFWIYRYPDEKKIREISDSTIRLLRLLTADDKTRCEIFTKKDFKENQRVRITGGIYAGYEGFVQRVKKNRHVIVRIEGICLILLPYIHPDLIQAID